NNNYSGVHFAAPEDVIDKVVTIKFDYKTSSVSSASNAASEIFLANLLLTENTPTYNEVLNGGKGVSFSSATMDLSANTQYAVTITINNKTKEATVLAQPATGTAITYPIDNAVAAINTIYFRPGKGVTDTVDNVTVTLIDAE
ncbi:MAG: hypothetical protein ACI4A5_11885, partial [Hominilimicola sp.]